MDDSMDTVPSEKAAVELYNQVYNGSLPEGLLESGCQTSLKCYS